MSVDVRGFLIDKGLIAASELPTASGEFRINCVKCGETDRKLYINGKGLGVHCFKCELSQTWRAFQRRYEPPTPEEVAMERFVSHCAEILQNDPKLMEFFTSRGITPEVVAAQKFGFCDPALMYEHADVDIIGNPPEQGAPNLCWYDGRWFLANRFIIPYIRDGVVTEVRGRKHPDASEYDEKYMSLPGHSGAPYYPSSIDPNLPVVISEGELDATVLRQNGIQSIGCPGATNAQPSWFSQYHSLFIAFDGDDAGRQGADKLIAHLPEVRRIEMPAGYDSSDYIEAFGIASFADLMGKATLYLQGKIQKDDRFATIVNDYSNWAWTNDILMGPSMAWAPRLEELCSGWAPGLILIGAEANCLAVGTEVLLYNGGVRKIEDVRVGDLLMGPDSQPRKVLETYRGTTEMHRVSPVYGDSYTVTFNHRLAVKHKPNTHVEEKDCLLTPMQWYNLTPTEQRHTFGYHVGVDFPQQPVEMDPYLLGLWLGDGNSRATAIENMEPEISAFLQAYADSNKMVLTIKNRDQSRSSRHQLRGLQYGINPMLKALKDYDLLGNKHIPSAFKVNTREIRLQVLAGIIDTDGHLASNGYYEIVQKSKQLADDIVFLSRSLGYHTSLRPVRKMCSNNGVVGDYYNIRISGSLAEVPVKVHRKKYKTPWDSPKDLSKSRLLVEPVGEGEYAGVRLDGDNLFLLSDFTVTHNSGKSCFLIKGLYEGAISHPDDIWVYLSLDDTMNEAMTRILSLHAKIDFKMVRSPKWYFNNDPALLQDYNDAVSSLAQIKNLILRDATYGRSLNYIRTFLKHLRTKYPTKRITIFVDSLAKITAESGEEDDASMMEGMGKNWKAFLASELKYLTTKYNICLVTPTDLRKINGDRRPVRDDLKDAAELAYEASIVLLCYNELMKNPKGALLRWNDPNYSPQDEPIFEVHGDKNKVTGKHGVIRYKMLGQTSDFFELTATEDSEWTQRITEHQAQEAQRRRG